VEPTKVEAFWQLIQSVQSMKQLHKILKKKREIKGYSQEYIAGIMKVSISTISRWESGEIVMTVDQIEDYAHALEHGNL